LNLRKTAKGAEAYAKGAKKIHHKVEKVKKVKEVRKREVVL
jgi:hypothetical protein